MMHEYKREQLRIEETKSHLHYMMGADDLIYRQLSQIQNMMDLKV